MFDISGKTRLFPVYMTKHAILDGRHSVERMAECLFRHEYLPLEWHEQRWQLGFNPE